jgi:hypothetical protein
MLRNFNIKVTRRKDMIVWMIAGIIGYRKKLRSRYILCNIILIYLSYPYVYVIINKI